MCVCVAYIYTHEVYCIHTRNTRQDGSWQRFFTSSHLPQFALASSASGYTQKVADLLESMAEWLDSGSRENVWWVHGNSWKTPCSFLEFLGFFCLITRMFFGMVTVWGVANLRVWSLKGLHLGSLVQTLLGSSLWWSIPSSGLGGPT